MIGPGYLKSVRHLRGANHRGAGRPFSGPGANSPLTLFCLLDGSEFSGSRKAKRRFEERLARLWASETQARVACPRTHARIVPVIPVSTTNVKKVVRDQHADLLMD